jgi:hypothetical protein
MAVKTWLVGFCAILMLAGCSREWRVDYPQDIEAEVSREWRLAAVVSVVPDTLRVSNSNSYAPGGDIVWWGEPYGDRRAQVARIFEEAVRAGASELQGERPVTVTATVQRFHAVTPAAVAAAPAAVHNIIFRIQVFDTRTAEALTEPVEIEADLEAYVGTAAMASAIRGEDQRTRIVSHLTAIIRGWLGYGPDQRRTFQSIGR